MAEAAAQEDSRIVAQSAAAADSVSRSRGMEEGRTACLNLD